MVELQVEPILSVVASADFDRPRNAHIEAPQSRHVGAREGKHSPGPEDLAFGEPSPRDELDQGPHLGSAEPMMGTDVR